MPHASFFLGRRLLGKPLPIDGSFARVRVHGEVSDLECGQVLEKMAALRWSHAEVAESRFHDRTRSRDFIPFHRDSKPRIVRSPAPDTNQQVRAVLSRKGGIEVSH